MSSLTVYHMSSPQVPHKLLCHAQDIGATLAEVGVRLLRQPVPTRLQPGAEQQAVLAACAEPLQQLRSEYGCTQVEVCSLLSQQPQYAESDAELPGEWLSTDDELHWMVAGRGVLGMRVGEAVYALQAEEGDLLWLPAGIHYWLDGGEYPRLSAIRLFKGAANPASEQIAGRFPRLED